MNTIPASSTMSTSTSAPKRTVAKKEKVTVTITPLEAAPVVAEPVAATTPAPKKRVPSTSNSKTKADAPPVALTTPVVAEPVAAASEPAPVTDASASAVADSTWNDDITGVTRHLATMRETLTSLFTEVKRLEKKVARTIKDASKRRKNRVKVDSNGEDVPKRPTVFNQPQNITDALNHFLGQEKGTQMSRAQVTKAVTGYAKAHKLMEGHSINTDAALNTLLNPSGNLKDGEKLNIFNLQTCLRNHYIKSVPVASAPVAHASA